MGRCNFMRILSGFERLLLLGGLLLVAAYAAARFYSVVYSPATLRDFWLNQAATAHQRVRPIQPIREFRIFAYGHRSALKRTRPAQAPTCQPLWVC
jgi:hypothetical protein